ncbi:tyrosine-protein kinase Fyn [Clonorchis sinensis]|uniref:Tyrosine-protein kinase n=1 Tax=Clonorchis sinensis TaxID=79923 RepID=G7YA30_CLOSI|nr:tyrosine-protein kinase Fyn [Clonorchis sinensis]
MGNCIPSQIDQRQLVESPQRVSLLNDLAYHVQNTSKYQSRIVDPENPLALSQGAWDSRTNPVFHISPRDTPQLTVAECSTDSDRIFYTTTPKIKHIKGSTRHNLNTKHQFAAKQSFPTSSLLCLDSGLESTPSLSLFDSTKNRFFCDFGSHQKLCTVHLAFPDPQSSYGKRNYLDSGKVKRSASNDGCSNHLHWQSRFTEGSPNDSGLGSCSICATKDRQKTDDLTSIVGVCGVGDPDVSENGRAESDDSDTPPRPPRTRRRTLEPDFFAPNLPDSRDATGRYVGFLRDQENDACSSESFCRSTSRLKKVRKLRKDVAVCTAPHVKSSPFELTIQVGEMLNIVHQNPLGYQPSSPGSWLFVERPTKLDSTSNTPSRGFVPLEKLQIVDLLPVKHAAWFEVDREEAEKMLLVMGHPSGTYILRASSDSMNAFALSIRCFDRRLHTWLVKHYRVRYRLSKGRFYIFHRASFHDVDQLLAYHSIHADGLPCRLTQPYPRSSQNLSSLTHLEVERSSFIFVQRLGRGSFGEVWQAVWNKRTPVAIKRLISDENMETEKFLEEARIMNRLNHPRIVRLMAVCTQPTSEPPLIVTELMELGSLKDYMQNLSPGSLSFMHLIKMITWVTEAMVYLEKNNFVHRDLRASNVLVNSKHQLKVADFGLSHVLTDAEEYVGTIQTKFPVRWTAPEGMLKQIYSTKSDVWSFGVLVYEILTFCEVPYHGIASKDIKEYVCSGHRLPQPRLKVPVPRHLFEKDAYEMPKSELRKADYSCPEFLYAKMLQCWRTSPDLRPSFYQLNQYFDSLYEELCELT